MNLPSFEEYRKQFNFDKLSYDLQRYAPEMLKQSSDLFSQDQWDFLMASLVSVNLALLQNYHEWLAEMLRQSHQED